MKDDGKWKCKNKVLEFDLNLHFQPSQHGPACLMYGVCAIGAAAAKYKAQVYYKKKPQPLPEGVIS